MPHRHRTTLEKLLLVSIRQLDEQIKIRVLLTRAVRLLEKIAHPPEPPRRIPTSFHLSVSGESPET